MAAVLLRPYVVLMKVRYFRGKKAVRPAAAFVYITLFRTYAVILSIRKFRAKEHPKSESRKSKYLRVLINFNVGPNSAVRIDRVPGVYPEERLNGHGSHRLTDTDHDGILLRPGRHLISAGHCVIKPLPSP